MNNLKENLEEMRALRALREESERLAFLQILNGASYDEINDYFKELKLYATENVTIYFNIFLIFLSFIVPILLFIWLFGYLFHRKKKR